jgi:membrane protein YdbS with pleckstrin-like domain
MTVQLHANALFYLVLRHAFKLAVLGLFTVLFVMGDAVHGTVNGHPAVWQAPRLLFLGIYIVFVLGVILYHWLLVKSYSIELTKDGVALHYGVINLSRETLLYTKVQDIVITRNLLERMLGLSTMMIQNAAGKPEYIPALGADIAENLRASILANAKA